MTRQLNRICGWWVLCMFIVACWVPRGLQAAESLAGILSAEAAEAVLPPPLPIVALTPQSVFDSPHPMIRAAVQAWIASLGGNRDRFGNLITSSYVTARTPDSLRPALVDFIARYVDGKILVGIDGNHANALANLQAHQRAVAVRHMVYDSLTDEQKRALQGPDDPQTGPDSGPEVTLAKRPQGRSVDLDVTARGGPEEIPSMFQDSDGDPEDAEREILTNAAPAPGRAGEIEERYGVHISSEPMEFLSHELDTLQDVLSQLPASYYQNDLTFMRMGVVRDNAGNPLRTRYAQILWSSQDGAPLPSTIQLSNLYMDQTVIDYHEGHRFPIRYFKDPALIRDLLLRSVFIHEMAHNYTFQINESFVSMAQTPLVQDWARQFGWTRDDSGPTNTGYAYDCGRSAEAPSGYGTTDVVEDIAESAALYMLSPGQLGRGDDRIRGGMTRTQFLKERMDLDGYTGVVPGSDRPEVEPMCMRVHCDCEAVPG